MKSGKQVLHVHSAGGLGERIVPSPSWELSSGNGIFLNDRIEKLKIQMKKENIGGERNCPKVKKQGEAILCKVLPGQENSAMRH